MRILVTGATGHIGTSVVPRLLREGHDVAALIRPQSNVYRLHDVRSRITLIRFDSAAVEEDVRAFRPDGVIHLAWNGITRGTRNRPEQIVENIPYSLDVLRIAKDAGAKSWIGLGSQAEYGRAGTTLTESLPAVPDTAYGIAKAAVSNLTRAVCQMSGMRHVWLRLVATYGPWDDESHLIPTLIRSLSDGSCPSLSSGTQLVDYLYVADAADAIAECARQPDVEGIFNLGFGRSISVKEVAELVHELLAPGVPMSFGPPDDTTVDLKVDVARFREATGWRPMTSLRDGLASTIAWYVNRDSTGAHA